MKTIEEKAYSHVEKIFGGIIDKYQTAPWNELRDALAEIYLAGAAEALKGQWQEIDEECKKYSTQRLCITKSKDFDNRTETRFCEWDGENFIDLYDDSVIRPYAFLPIPEPPKDESA